jgi:hypothetical protein
MTPDDDFLKFFTETLGSVTGLDQAAKPAPSPAPAAQATPPVAAVQQAVPAAQAPKAGRGLGGKKIVYVGFEDATRTVFQQNLSVLGPFVDTADLQSIKNMLQAGEIGLLVFDGTSFIKPGIPITRFIKEKGLPVKIAHVYGEQRITEEYEKYRQYHVHLQPDYRGLTDEIFMVVDKIRKDLEG